MVQTPLLVATVGPVRTGREVLGLPPSAATKRAEGGNTRTSLCCRHDAYRRYVRVTHTANSPPFQPIMEGLGGSGCACRHRARLPRRVRPVRPQIVGSVVGPQVAPLTIRLLSHQKGQK